MVGLLPLSPDRSYINYIHEREGQREGQRELQNLAGQLGLELWYDLDLFSQLR